MTAFRIGFVPGVSPDKWAETWRRRSLGPLELVPVEEPDQRAALTDGRVAMCFVRLPVERDGLHCIPLWHERPVVVVPLEHVVTAYDEIDVAELAGEQVVYGAPAVLEPTVEQLPFPEMSAKDAIEVVASGTGVAVMPMSLARLHHRKDVDYRFLLGVPETRIGLAWRVDDDDPRLETFVSIVRGRTENSSRDLQAPPKKPRKKRH